MRDRSFEKKKEEKENKSEIAKNETKTLVKMARYLGYFIVSEVLPVALPKIQESLKSKIDG